MLVRFVRSCHKNPRIDLNEIVNVDKFPSNSENSECKRCSLLIKQLDSPINITSLDINNICTICGNIRK